MKQLSLSKKDDTAGGTGWLYILGGLSQKKQSLQACRPYQAILLQQLTHTPPSGRTRGMQLWGLLSPRCTHPTSIALQSWGILKSTIRVLLSSMQTMQYVLKTGFGMSEEFYGGTE